MLKRRQAHALHFVSSPCGCECTRRPNFVRNRLRKVRNKHRTNACLPGAPGIPAKLHLPHKPPRARAAELLNICSKITAKLNKCSKTTPKRDLENYRQAEEFGAIPTDVRNTRTGFGQCLPKLGHVCLELADIGISFASVYFSPSSARLGRNPHGSAPETPRNDTWRSFSSSHPGVFFRALMQQFRSSRARGGR